MGHALWLGGNSLLIAVIKFIGAMETEGNQTDVREIDVKSPFRSSRSSGRSRSRNSWCRRGRASK